MATDQTQGFENNRDLNEQMQEQPPIFCFQCPQCATPLLSDIDLNDPKLTRHSLAMSYAAMKGEAYAINVYRQNGGCPICGSKSPQFRGVPPSEPRNISNCTRRLSEQESDFLQNHSKVHLNMDALLNSRVATSAEYAFAHSALRHYVLGAGSSIFGNFIGFVGLMERGNPCPAIAQLCNLVESRIKRRLDRTSIVVGAYAIRGGSCIVIALPEPPQVGDAYLIGLASSIQASELNDVDISKIEESPQFFTLEKTQATQNRPYPTMLCQWRSRNRDDYYGAVRNNYGSGPLPRIMDFVDCVERIMVSGVYKD